MRRNSGSSLSAATMRSRSSTMAGGAGAHAGSVTPDCLSHPAFRLESQGADPRPAGRSQVLYGSCRMSSRVALVTDSTAEIPPDLAAERGIHSVPTTVTVGGQSYRDGVDITAAEFYEKLRATEGAATTSQPSVGEFSETYERLLA